MNSPDNFAWILFARINKLAPSQPTVNGHVLNNALWETWADDGLTYDNPSISHPPQWPAGGITVPAEPSPFPFNFQAIPLKRLREPLKRQIFDIQRQVPLLSHM